MSLIMVLIISSSAFALSATRTINGNTVTVTFSDLGATNELNEVTSGSLTILTTSLPNYCQVSFNTRLKCNFAPILSLTYQTSGSGTVSGTLTSFSPPSSTQTYNLVTENIPSTPSCTNECGDAGLTQCSGSLVQVCGNFDADSCLEWSSANACDNDGICQAGSCTLGGEGPTLSSCTNADYDFVQKECPVCGQAPVYATTTKVKKSGAVCEGVNQEVVSSSICTNLNLCSLGQVCSNNADCTSGLCGDNGLCISPAGSKTREQLVEENINRALNTFTGSSKGLINKLVAVSKVAHYLQLYSSGDSLPACDEASCSVEGNNFTEDTIRGYSSLVRSNLANNQLTNLDNLAENLRSTLNDLVNPQQ